jgi:hypothetical protein
MGNNRQVFDYDQPTRDCLAGIYVEASDEAWKKRAVSIPGLPASQCRSQQHFSA